MELTLNARPLSPLTGEATLVDAARHGDDRAFEQLYARYRERIHAFILSKVRDHGRAEDLGQEVFMSALRQLRASDREIVFKPWLYTIAKNACIDEFRRGARAREVSIESDEELGAAAGERFLSAVPTPAAAVESKQSLADLRGAFSGLSDSQHKLLVMREFEGLTYDEIGERLGMTKQMVESGLFRARRRLGEEYDELASGRRCQQIQTAIDAGTLRTVRGMGIKDKRRYSRHLSHCQLCRHQALMAGIDDALLTKRSIAAKVAALLPFPLLRKLWPFGHGGGAASAATGAGGAGGAGGAVAAGGAAAAGAAGAGVGQAAAIAALALAGAGGGLAIAEHASHHHAVAPAPAVRHHVAPAVAPAQRTTPQSAAVRGGTASRTAQHRAAQAARKAAAGARAHSRAAATAPLGHATARPTVAPARATRGAAAPIADPIQKTRTATRLPVAGPSGTTPTSSAPTGTGPTSSPPTSSNPTHTTLTSISPVLSASPIAPTASPVTSTLTGVATTAGSAVATTGAAAGGAVSAAGSTAGGAVTAVGTAAGGAVTAVGTAAGGAVGAVGAGTPVGPITGALGGAVAGAGQGAGSAVGGVAGAAGSTVTGASAATGTTATSATGAVGKTLAGATQGVGGAVGGLLGDGS
jgi:RNA polymerase sigma factor (sigma-70 family)